MYWTHFLPCVPPLWSFSIGLSGATFLASPCGLEEFYFSAQLDNGDLIPDRLVNYFWRCYPEGKTMELWF